MTRFKEENNPYSISCTDNHNWQLINTPYTSHAECLGCGEISHDQELIDNLITSQEWPEEYE